MNTLGLMPVRVRSESPAFAARFAYVAGANSYNTWINERVSAAIQASGGGYVPAGQVPGAGFGDRNCLAGSSRWPATDVLSNAATGASVQPATVLVCDVPRAFGNN